MGVAALVLGIISIVIGFIPFCGAIAFVPAIIGLILGIVDIVKKSKSKEPKGMAIAGTVLSAIAVIVISFWIFVVGVATHEFIKNPDQIMEQINEEYDRYYSEILDNGSEDL